MKIINSKIVNGKKMFLIEEEFNKTIIKAQDGANLDSEGRAFIKNWYTQRSELPQFKDISNKFLKSLPLVKTINVSKAHLKEKNATAYELEGDIYINNKDVSSKESVVHEITHAVHDRSSNYLYGEDIIKKNIVPKPEYKVNYYDFGKFDYNYYSNPTEVYARLNTFRDLMKLDPKKNYSTEDAKSLIEQYKNPKAYNEKQFKADKDKDLIAIEYNKLKDNYIKLNPKNDVENTNIDDFMDATNSYFIETLDPKFFNEVSEVISKYKSIKNKYDFKIDKSDDIETLFKIIGDDPIKLSNLLNNLADNNINETEKLIGKYGIDNLKNETTQLRGVIEDNQGQWKYPGQITKINSPNITMKGVNYPVLGISEQTGEQKLMFPENNYKFKSTKAVIEYPITAQAGTTVKVNKDNVVKEYDRRSPEYKAMYDSGKLMSYDKSTDTYTATPLETVEVKTKAPQWLIDKRNIEKNFTKEKFVKKYLPKWSGSMGETADNLSENAQKDYDKKVNDKLANVLLKSNQKKGNKEANNLDWYNSFSEKEREIIQQSSLANKFAPAQRAYDLDVSNSTKKYNTIDVLTDADKLSQSVQGTPERFRLFPNAENNIESYVNPGMFLGSMAKGLGNVPKDIKNENYGQAALSIATPLGVGALAGIGNPNTGQFVNNIANPLAGTGNLVNKYPLNIYKTIKSRIFPKEANFIIPEQSFTRKIKDIYNNKTGLYDIYEYDLPKELYPSRSYEDVQHKMKNLRKDLNIGNIEHLFNKLFQKGETRLYRDATIVGDDGGLFDSNTRYWLNREYGNIPTVGSSVNDYSFAKNFGKKIKEGLSPLESEQLVKSYKQVELPKEIELPKPPKNFKSEIDWEAWVRRNKNWEVEDMKIIRKNRKEYDLIEHQTKANNTWMKNPDGSAFQGTPEQFVQQNSENFKKAFPEYHGEILNHNTNAELNTIDESFFNKGAGDTGYYGKGTYAHPKKEYTKMYGKNNYELYLNSKNKGFLDKSNIDDAEYFKRSDNEILQHHLPEYENKLMNYKLDPSRYYDNAKENWLNKLNEQVKAGKISRDKLDEFTSLHNPKNGEVVIPFNNRVKSAVGNNGMFDMTNPNIYKTLVGGLATGTLGKNAMKKKEFGGKILDTKIENGKKYFLINE